MLLAFADLNIENFKSFAGKHRIRLSKFGNGLHYFKGRNDAQPRLGRNGTGKSTVWDAVCWCLYGRTPKGLRNVDVRPWQGEGTTSVRLQISRDDRAYLIERTIAPNLLSVDGKECGQEHIDRLIGLDYTLFTNCVLLGQGEPLFFDLQPREKMDLFVRALDLHRWDERAEWAAGRVGKLSAAIAKAEAEQSTLDALLLEVEMLREAEVTKAQTWDERIQASMRDDEKRLGEYQKSLAVIENAAGKHDLEYDGAETEARASKRQLEALEEALLDADRKHERAVQKRKALRGSIAQNEHLLAALKEGDACPTCGQALKNANQVKRHAEELRTLIASAKQDLRDIGVDALREQAEGLERKIKKVRGEYQAFDDKATKARDAWEFNQKEANTLKADIKALKQALAEHKDRENPHHVNMASLKQRARSLKAQVEEGKAAIAADAKKLERAKFWTKGFKDVRLYIMERVIAELEIVTNALAQEAGLIDWHVAFAIEKESASGNVTPSLAITIKSPESGSKKAKWETWSGGEGQRLRIIGALALSECLLARAGVEPDIEILDEPTRHLSKRGVADLCDYLADRAQRLGKAIFYVDHQSVESARFASVTTIARDAQGSFIERDQ